MFLQEVRAARQLTPQPGLAPDYDLIGPAPPTGVSLQSADTELYVNWGQVVVTDLSGYNIYCQNLAQIDGGLAQLQSYDGRVLPMRGLSRVLLTIHS